MGAMGGSRARLTMQTVPDASGRSVTAMARQIASVMAVDEQKRTVLLQNGAWTASPGRITGTRKKGPRRIPQSSGFCGWLLDSTTTLHHARVGNFQPPPPITAS
ncbi:hypothetical protein PSPO01_02709 [Paraphaeosphaeria sporulosa]